MVNFEARLNLDGGPPTVVLTGECDLTSQDRLAAVLAQALAGDTDVLVDAARLDFIDSSGINALISAHRTARAKGLHLYLVNAVHEVATVLDITGVGELLRPRRAD
jgi:anti-sigma B factor antagonist